MYYFKVMALKKFTIVEIRSVAVHIEIKHIIYISGQASHFISKLLLDALHGAGIQCTCCK